ncbi:MAG: hypothetical protein Q7T52_01605, partial [Nocardioides sp.]|nr:hypothetical protein [Nocardioides sp.]
MPSTHRITRTSSSDPLLESVRGACLDISRDEVNKLSAVLDWAAAHTAGDTEAAELHDWNDEPPLQLAGVGAPVVAEYAALDLALSIGRSSDSGLAYLGKALELRYRLPRIYARVVRLEIPVWLAFRVADQTRPL